MNATGEGEEHPELPTPLSAPVAASMLDAPGLNAYFPGPDDPSPAYRQVPDQPAAPAPPSFSRPAAHQPASPAASPGPGAGPGEQDRAPGPGGSGPADETSDALTEDPHRVWMLEHLDAVRARAAGASSWLETSVYYARLLNRDGVVPVTARFTRDDIEFLGRAREEVLGFAELCLRLLELHAPLDAGGISTDPSSPILRCRSCMWRWPCPTFRMLTDALSHLPHPGSPPAL